jgi:hypothetical protein
MDRLRWRNLPKRPIDKPGAVVRGGEVEGGADGQDAVRVDLFYATAIAEFDFPLAHRAGQPHDRLADGPGCSWSVSKTP